MSHSRSKEVKMPGYEDGERWQDDDGTTHTVNSTNDPNVGEGGYYHSVTEPDGNKETSVYESDGTLADVKANKDWKSL